MRKTPVKPLKIKANTPAFELIQLLGDRGAANDFIFLKKPGYFSPNRFYNAVRKLKDNKLIKKEKDKIKLTEKGVLEYARTKIEKTDLLPEGTDCIVVFDIPETERKIRDFLSKLLEEIAFIRIQKSVWISPFDNAAALKELLQLLGYKKWVRIYNGQECK
ncbi:MAG: hypothetical protein UW63_C0048G0005 [Candidatus Uhrbacteria bacterium GW2011_GWF2_44_350]|uniref:Transcriptional repressor PaaX-like central Cas2-like domain-containing protein n=1 Tax=Candidatus Uhrbacteria bacterium GW2011_GWF2_44_350 TaxID=1619000 RepID=A0A0G1JEI3_9BACT|nr:MAG: hypothetical protein UW63_C0048G0005 [Candidatus Uhrbacteria bacterium GW2011_GWF2_44_350]